MTPSGEMVSEMHNAMATHRRGLNRAAEYDGAGDGVCDDARIDGQAVGCKSVGWGCDQGAWIQNSSEVRS